MRTSSIDPPAGLTILYKDEWLCAVDKPAGIPMQPDRTGDLSLLRLVKETVGGEPGLVHRLDRPVSGVVVFALERQALRVLNERFRDRQVRKTYWCIVEGKWEGAEQVLEHRIQHDARAKKARIAAGPTAVEARLAVRPLATGDRFTLLEVHPQGGAFHQIRSQLAAAGAPIKGDVKYGARRGEKDRSIALHARRLRFQHPLHGRPLDIMAPPPAHGIWPALIKLAAGDTATE